MKKTIIISFFITLFVGFSSCEKLFLDKDPADTPVSNFDLLWNTLNEKYAFFTYKQIDWDSVYHVFRPKIYQGMSNRELFDVMSDMLYLLKDGHTNLISPFNVSRNWDWYLNSPPNFNFNVVERNYLKNDYRISGGFYNTVIDSVGYIYYGSFDNDVSAEQVEAIARSFRHLKGIIIDVRNNDGGDPTNGEIIASVFTTQKTLTAYWLYKSGPGHNEFMNPEPHYIEPSGNFTFTKPVAVLTNRLCFSATNDFVMMMRALPNVIIVGDTTGGGGGVPIESELPNGWIYRFSSTMTLAPDGFNVEAGIPPHVKVDISPADEANGIDSIIERAIEEIKNR